MGTLSCCCCHTIDHCLWIAVMYISWESFWYVLQSFIMQSPIYFSPFSSKGGLLLNNLGYMVGSEIFSNDLCRSYCLWGSNVSTPTNIEGFGGYSASLFCDSLWFCRCEPEDCFLSSVGFWNSYTDWQFQVLRLTFGIVLSEMLAVATTSIWFIEVWFN